MLATHYYPRVSSSLSLGYSKRARCTPCHPKNRFRARAYATIEQVKVLGSAKTVANAPATLRVYRYEVHRLRQDRWQLAHMA